MYLSLLSKIKQIRRLIKIKQSLIKNKSFEQILQILWVSVREQFQMSQQVHVFACKLSWVVIQWKKYWEVFKSSVGFPLTTYVFLFIRWTTHCPQHHDRSVHISFKVICISSWTYHPLFPRFYRKPNKFKRWQSLFINIFPRSQS